MFPKYNPGKGSFHGTVYQAKKDHRSPKLFFYQKYLNFTFVLWWTLGPVIWKEEILRNWCGNISAHFGGWRRKIGGWGGGRREGGGWWWREAAWSCDSRHPVWLPSPRNPYLFFYWPAFFLLAIFFIGHFFYWPILLWLPPSSMASLPPSTPTYTNT